MNHTKEEVITMLGIGSLEPELQEQTLGTFLNTLEQRTGEAVSDSLSDEQLEEFEKVVDAQGDEAAEQWLRQAVADYDDIEEKQFLQLIDEVNEASN